MKNDNMTVVHSADGKIPAVPNVFKVPKAPAHLCAAGKKCYTQVAEFLAKKERINETSLQTLEIFAAAYAQWQFACVAINKKNREKAGSGYIQKYSTGATNITTEMVVRNDAADTMLKCSKQFGLDPKSEKDLKAAVDANQLDLFDMWRNQKAN